MKSQAFGNFQVGIVDNPSVEDKGGFEFASGMDIFSETGVLKACNAMVEVSYGASATPTAVPLWMVNTESNAYISAGTKILESTDGATFNLFRTNTKGANIGLGLWAGFVVYISSFYTGLVQIGNAGTAVDDYFTFSQGILSDFSPLIIQGGTLKIGADRYVHSVSEALALTEKALKLPSGTFIISMVEHFNNAYMGTKAQQTAGQVTTAGSSVFGWGGTVLSTGSALPNDIYEMSLRGMPALLNDNKALFAFPDRLGDVLEFDGVGFVSYRKLPYLANKGKLIVNPGAVTQYRDSVLFAGNTDVIPGVFQMKDKAICQSFVPAGATPGVDSSINIGFVKPAFDGTVYIGYYKTSNTSYHIEKSTSNKQNGAVMQTVWHRLNTDKFKRWGGIKLNLKPMAANTSVAVAYRTDRNAAFTDSGVTISSANQDKSVIFAAQPRSREIQFKFTYTTSTTNTPELLSYDPLFEVLKTVR